MVRFWGCRCCWIPGAAHPVGVLVERVDEALPVNAPHFDRLVVRRCHQSLAIMGESNTAYSGSVGFEHFWLSFSRVHRHITTNTTENTTSLKHAAQPQLACNVWPLTDTSNCAQQGHLFYISYYSPIMGHIILLSKQRSPDYSGKNDLSLHGWCPQSHSSVFGGSGHQVTRGGEMHPSDDVLVAYKAESPRLWSQIPDHQAVIHWPRG